MKEVSLSDILQAREERVRLQSDISMRFKCPIISFTMNIAGPRKNSPLVSRAFNLGLDELDKLIPEEKIIYKHIDPQMTTGPIAIYAIDEEAEPLKSICVKIEEATALGRLFDMDVIDTSFKKLTRPVERGCIVCGTAGRYCAASRAHSADVVAAKMNEIMIDELFLHDSRFIADLVRKSLIDEVYTTPKPGLVDRRNNGSHNDMTIETFEASANSLLDYFKECVTIGRNTALIAYYDSFVLLREAGISAEDCMYNATGGVNTHKGAIFSFGLLCCAIGRLWTPEIPFSQTNTILSEAANLAKVAFVSDLVSPNGETAGERMYLERKSLGIRGEAASGFASVKNIALPIFRQFINDGLSKNDAGVMALIHLIGSIDDSAIYNRGGIEGLEFAKSYARGIIENRMMLNVYEIEKMDEVFIQRNLSAGGSADLLAVTYFLYELEKIATS